MRGAELWQRAVAEEPRPPLRAADKKSIIKKTIEMLEFGGSHCLAI